MEKSVCMLLKPSRMAIFLLPFLLIGAHFVFMQNSSYLTFVDAARYADIGRNLAEGIGFKGSYTFPRLGLLSGPWVSGTTPSYILILSLIFRVLPANDLTVITTSILFYLGLCFASYFLAKRIFGKEAALLAFIIVSLESNLLASARSGAAETFVAFLIVTILLLIATKKQALVFLSGLLSIVLFFTKIQGPIYLLAPLLFLLLTAKERIKSLLIFLLPQLLLFLVVQSKFFPQIPRWGGVYFSLFLQNSPLFPADVLPRSGGYVPIDMVLGNTKTILIKTFYNLYNFGKSLNFANGLPQTASPLVIILFVISLFTKNETKEAKDLKACVLISFLILLILVSATVPHVRYLHPFIPLFAILAASYLKEVTEKFPSKIKKIGALSILFFFIAFIPFGSFFLDERFNKKYFNADKPPVNYLIGKKIGDITKKGSTIVTNLDTWASWYGRINSVMIPLTKEDFMEIDKTLKANAIVLTDYQKDNSDHPLEGYWLELFENPKILSDSFTKANFAFKTEMEIRPEEIYENQNYRIVILTRK